MLLRCRYLLAIELDLDLVNWVGRQDRISIFRRQCLNNIACLMFVCHPVHLFTYRRPQPLHLTPGLDNWTSFLVQGFSCLEDSS